MKKIIKILYIIIFILVLSGCNGQKNMEEDYDISIISTDKISLFKQYNGSITLQKEIKRNDNFGFLKEDYFNLKDKMFIKTTVIGKKALLAKINKNTLNIDLKKMILNHMLLHVTKIEYMRQLYLLTNLI